MNTILFLQSLATPLLDKIFQIITMTAEEIFLILIVTILFWCLDKRFGYILCFSLVFSTSINVILKALFDSPRPINVEGIRSLRVETAGGSSFPSGHTQGAATFWAAIWFEKRHKILGVFSLILVILVGLSRLYLGLHWPKDVIAAIFIGLFATYFIHFLYNKYPDKMKSIFLYILVIPVVLALIFIQDEHIVKMGGMAIGLYFGFVFENRYIKFSPHSTLSRNFAKSIIGITGLLAIKMGLSLVFPDTNFWNLTRYILMGFWIDAMAPWLFVKFKLTPQE